MDTTPLKPCPFCGGTVRFHSAGDDGRYPPCDYCAEPLSYHPWHGSGLINGVESRHIHACDKCRHLLPAVSAGGVDERVPELSSFAAFADALGLDLRQPDDQWNSALALYEKLIAAYPQARAALSAPNHSDQARNMVPDGWNVERGCSPSGYVLHSPGGSMIRVCDSGMGGIETAFAMFLKAMLAATPSAGSQGGDV